MIQKEDNCKADRIDIVYYTDPLCCWSWAFEPAWQQFQKQYADHINIRYCMGGFIPDWGSFSDPSNSIFRPSHMGPFWMEVSQKTGVYVNDTIWVDDPPASSYPSCIAVKTAELQSQKNAAALLLMLRKAVMEEGKNIADHTIISNVAAKLEKESGGEFNLRKFKADMQQQNGFDPFRADLREIRNENIIKFPTLTFNYPGRKGVIISGYRLYQVLVEVMQLFNPELLAK